MPKLKEKKATKKNIYPEDTIVIKKYPNRRLYNTSTSAYIVLKDLIGLVKENVEFVVEDAKTGENITRSIMNQIIFEQEAQHKDFLLPLEFQKQLISMYGDTYGHLVPDYLTQSIGLFVSEREQIAKAYNDVINRNTDAMMEYGKKLAEQNTKIFMNSWDMMSGVVPKASADKKKEKPASNKKDETNELDDIQQKIDALQSRLHSLK